MEVAEFESRPRKSERTAQVVRLEFFYTQSQAHRLGLVAIVGKCFCMVMLLYIHEME